MIKSKLSEIKMDKMPLPQPQRIKKRRIFQAATHNGRKFVSTGMVLQVIKSPFSDVQRVGFTTTKKLGNAVVRNRIRRRLKEVCRFILPLDGVSGYDYVIVGRKSAFDRSFTQLTDDLKYLLRQFKKTLAEKEGISENFNKEKEVVTE